MPRKPATPKAKPAAKRTNGRPPFEPTDAMRQRVQLAVADGRTQHEIAARLGICKMTLLKHFRPELDRGADRVREVVTGHLHRKALQGFWPAVQFLARSRYGYAETHNHKIGGDPDAPPIQIATLSTEQLIAALATLDGAARAGAGADRRGIAAEEDSD